MRTSLVLSSTLSLNAVWIVKVNKVFPKVRSANCFLWSVIISVRRLVHLSDKEVAIIIVDTTHGYDIYGCSAPLPRISTQSASSCCSSH